MIGITNVGGAGGQSAFAYIGVTYPAGATVTCSNGTRTLTTRDTSGLYVFPVPNAGTWTVSGTNGVETFTQAVSITNKWQDVIVDVKFWDGELFWNGNQYTSITGGWAYNAGYKISGLDQINFVSIGTNMVFTRPSNSSRSCCVPAGNRIDLSNVASITVEASDITNTGSASGLNGNAILVIDDHGPGTSSRPYAMTSSVVKQYKNLSNGTNTITLESGSKGNYYVLIASSAGGMNTNPVISKIKLNFAS